jgi:CHAD domain-containing protein/CYTH domain-containing protein
MIAMKHYEIERRFLLYPCSMKKFLKKEGLHWKSIEIKQFYLTVNADESVRCRQYGDRYVKTVKRGSGMVREEFEIEISKDAFEKAECQNRGGVIKKIRRIVKVEGRIFEVDSFKKPLKGLNLLEVEFESEADAKAFELPESFKRILVDEVTENRDFSNGVLSRTMQISPIETPLHALLTQIDQREDFLKASTDVVFDAYESGAHAVKVLFYTLLKTIEANRNAILSKDRDPERLHQLRVAMRKLRALLSQMKPLFDPVWHDYHKQQLAVLMRQTARRRDIDVYLEEIPRYKQMLPKHLREGLNALEHYLVESAEESGKELIAFLQSRAFNEEIETFSDFCTSEESMGLSDRSRFPVILEVKRTLRKRYAQVLKKGHALDDTSPADAYHLLRIDVKKLRYLMEFFASLFDPDAYAAMLKRLKTIQAILGMHQDLEVQHQHLKRLSQLPQLHNDKTAAALEVLRKEMERLEACKRHEFRETFKAFAETRELFHTMICKF